MTQEQGRPQTPSDAGLFKFLRFVDPEDPTKVMELATYKIDDQTEDGKDLYALVTTSAASTATMSWLQHSGTGEDDMGVGGSYSGLGTRIYKVEIDGGDPTYPNTFRWSDDGGTTWNDEGVVMDAQWQELSYGVKVRFQVLSGHDDGDYWTFSCTGGQPYPAPKMQEELLWVSPGPGANFYGNFYDFNNVFQGCATVSGEFNASATQGMTVDLQSSPDQYLIDSALEPWVEGLEPTFEAGARRTKTTNLDIQPRFIRAHLVVLDATYGVAGVYCTITAKGS